MIFKTRNFKIDYAHEVVKTTLCLFCTHAYRIFFEYVYHYTPNIQNQFSDKNWVLGMESRDLHIMMFWPQQDWTGRIKDKSVGWKFGAQ